MVKPIPLEIRKIGSCLRLENASWRSVIRITALLHCLMFHTPLPLLLLLPFVYLQCWITIGDVDILLSYPWWQRYWIGTGWSSKAMTTHIFMEPSSLWKTLRQNIFIAMFGRKKIAQSSVNAEAEPRIVKFLHSEPSEPNPPSRSSLTLPTDNGNGGKPIKNRVTPEFAYELLMAEMLL